MRWNPDQAVAVLCCRLHLYRNCYFWSPPPLHLQAQFPLHEPLVDANGSKTQSQRLRPVTFALPTEGASSSSRPPLRRQMQLASVTKEPVPGASEAEPAMVTAAVDKGRGPVGQSLANVAIGYPVPFPPVPGPVMYARATWGSTLPRSTSSPHRRTSSTRRLT